ncbi:hypothetical protein K505DRAFT_161200 [Melanomma pulvis-pyrius CBS 109.77]|uniref:Uncharacterized protein n=1 Tax=Melanomma pulvis-pyrius CBS 109.77 TaxID=1314802 RepID=A0A6A6WPK1_9PLEO|nr:hypothetical protein K505DRAFT_161200 [Melanomma pulvis-pyrius CBS 109.77]
MKHDCIRAWSSHAAPRHGHVVFYVLSLLLARMGLLIIGFRPRSKSWPCSTGCDSLLPWTSWCVSGSGQESAGPRTETPYIEWGAMP